MFHKRRRYLKGKNRLSALNKSVSCFATRGRFLPLLARIVSKTYEVCRDKTCRHAVSNQALPAPTAPAPDTRQPAPPEKPIAQQPTPDPSATDSRRLALAAYRAPESLSGVRGTAGDTDTLTLASKAFSQKNYRRALLLLSKLPGSDQQEGLSLRAHAHFGAGDFAAASRDFSDLEKGGVYRREAQWFGLLARMIAPGADKNLWMKQLDSIRQQPAHPYQREAKQLWKNTQ